MHDLFPHLTPILPETIFTSRHDAEDIRIGDLLAPFPKSLADLSSAIVLVGAPQDIGVARNGGRKGAKDAPVAIRKALYKLTPYLYDNGRVVSLSSRRLFDAGDILTDGSLEEIHQRLRSVVRAILDAGGFPIVLGGGHDIAYPDGAALGDVVQEIGVVNLDAHTDVRPLINGLAHSGSGFRQLLEDKSFTMKEFVEFGIQSFSASVQHCEYVQAVGGKVVFYDEIRKSGFEAAFAAALEKAATDTKGMYISFDIDAIASAYAPGVSAPAAMGFTAYEYCRASLMAGQHPKVRVIDIVEVNPMYDIDGRTAKLAALIAAHAMGGIAMR